MKRGRGLSCRRQTASVPLPSYELQVRRDAQGRGLGRWLLAQIEQAARLASMECVLLTTFIGTFPSLDFECPVPLISPPRLDVCVCAASVNKDALRFYERHGYTEDETSPSQCLDSEEAAAYDYAILGKKLA